MQGQAGGMGVNGIKASVEVSVEQALGIILSTNWLSAGFACSFCFRFCQVGLIDGIKEILYECS